MNRCSRSGPGMLPISAFSVIEVSGTSALAVAVSSSTWGKLVLTANAASSRPRTVHTRQYPPGKPPGRARLPVSRLPATAPIPIADSTTAYAPAPACSWLGS
ncbi:hypothetical protein [Streptomyces sp. WM6378]|uniref:hypothetical protein n=1 Tax=Streptomyces sp. WM6378 TaxID=1415557 RepID=UPI001F2B4428|nr:hypothetical protein [Streptomyces sp. WM6378]